MLKPSRVPDGYKNLLVYKKAEEMQTECSKITLLFPFSKTLVSLADQMNRSARSVKQNIVEGWKRNSTKEYYEFLGFSMGANKELEEDCDDVWKGIYADLMGIKGIMGEMGIPLKSSDFAIPLTPLTPFFPLSSPTTETPSTSTPLTLLNPLTLSDSAAPLVPLNPLHPFRPFDINKLKFYPLDRSLPPIVQLKLRCKEIDFLLHKLQLSLAEKMEKEKTISTIDKFSKIEEEKQKQEKFVKDIMSQNDLDYKN